MASRSRKRRLGTIPTRRRLNLTIETLEQRNLFAVVQLAPPVLSSPGQLEPDSTGGDQLASAAAVPSGLVAAWGFNEGSGGTVGDVSGNGLSGTISGATWNTSGKYGKALSFNGTSSMVTIADTNVLDLTAGMTLEAWVRPSTINDYETVILKERSGGLAYSLYGGSDGNGTPAGYITRTGTSTNIGAHGPTSLALNTWSHLATTYDGATIRLYVNGALVSSQAAAGSIMSTSNPLRIGGNAVWGEYFAGLIDEVRVYNRALSQSEIQTDMNTAVSSPPVSHRWAPLAYAGADFTADSPDNALLSGEVIANRPQGLTMSWTKVSGPGTVTFADPGVPSTTADFSTPGVYELMLTASNNWGTNTDRVVVTVLSDNDEEVLATNSPLTLAEGATSTISSARLRTTDADNTPVQLIYTITNGPSNGTVRLSGTATTTFTQADIDAGRVTYQHNGNETTTDSFTFRVNDAEGPGTTATFSISVTPVNDEQVLGMNSGLSVAKGAFAAITSAVLLTTDVDNTPAQLTYTITTGPSNGTLRRSGTATTSFTQADVNAGLITYQHNNSATTSDSFSFTVNDGQGTSTTATFNITVTAVNQEEVLATNTPLTVAEGATGTISSARLRTTDADNTPAQLIYTITSGPTNGTVRLSGAATTTFTQADIDAGRVTFQHNGSETTSASFGFRVNDAVGPGTTGTFNISVTAVNDEQVLSTNSGLSVAKGASAAIASSALSTTDVDNTPAQLTYTVTTAPSNGTLRRSGTATTSFTQADINAGLITYQHNNSATTSDSFTFAVNDGQGTSTTATFSINVNQSGGNLPDLPTSFVDTTLDPAYNRPADIFVAAGGNLQAAINSAQAGQIIELQAGATFTGNFTLPNKSGNGWIYIRSSGHANLPAGTRVGPADAANMAKLRSTNTSPVLTGNSNSHNFRFIGIEFENTYSATAEIVYQIILLNNNNRDITFDRCYIHGHPNTNTYDGIGTVGVRNLAVVNSYISEIHVAQGQGESHGIQLLGVTTAKIENNFISAAGENILVGDNFSTGTISSDITIRGNHFFKPLSWQNNIASGPNAGRKWIVKNLLELKEGNRVLIEGNLMENCWVHAQEGYALVLTPRGNPVSDVTFRMNVIKNVNRPFQVVSADDTLSDLLFENNLIFDVDSWLASTGRGVGPVTNWIIRHNTILGSISNGPIFIETGAPGIDGFIVYDNILRLNYAVGATGTTVNLPSLQHGADNYDWNNNLIVQGYGTPWATDSKFRGFLYESNVSGVGFTDNSLNDVTDFGLAASSEYKNAGTDGKDLGADIDAILAAMGSQVAGAQSSASGAGIEFAQRSAALSLGAPMVVPMDSNSPNPRSIFRPLPTKTKSSARLADADRYIPDNILSVTESRRHRASGINPISIVSARADAGTQQNQIESQVADRLFSSDVEGLLVRNGWEGLFGLLV
jgi:hypothetical protein